MDSLLNYLSYFDIFGLDIAFRHNRFIKYRNFYGGITTIFCGIFLIYAFLELSYDCIHKTNPLVRETSYYEDYSIVKGSNFFFAFYFTDSDFNFIKNPEKYLIFYANISNSTSNEGNIETIQFSKCNYDKHFNSKILTKEIINEKIKNFNNTFCLNFDNKINFINSGTEIPRLSLSLYVVECDNTTIHGVDCNFLLTLSRNLV